MILVALGFQSRTGKDTVASILVEGYGFKRLAFADSLKLACKEIFNFTNEQCFGDKKEEVDDFWGFTPRYILQKVGTECLRDVFDKDIWIKSLQRKLEPDGKYVISDLRFLNEANKVKSWGGILVNVIRPERDKISSPSHESEQDLAGYEGWDYVIDNSGTISDLKHKVDFFAQKLNI